MAISRALPHWILSGMIALTTALLANVSFAQTNDSPKSTDPKAPSGDAATSSSSFTRTLWHKNGQKQMEGRLLGDRREGAWTWWYDNGQEFAAMEYKAGVSVNVLRHWSADGKLLGEGEYRDGAEWNGTFIDFGGALQISAQRSYKDGQPHGEWMWWNENGGLRIEGAFDVGNRQGLWTWYYGDGQKFAEVHFDHGNFTDTESHWAPDGSLLTTGEYRDGQAWNGTFIEFSGSQLLVTFQRSYKDGQPHGEWTWWFADGALSTQGSFINGKKNGAWTWWFANGQKFAESDFDNGVPRGSLRHWGEDGTLLSEGQYALDGREWNGTFVDFTANLNVTAQRTFVDGQKDGVWSGWHDNGAKAFEANYKNGQPQGTWTWWDAEGIKTSEERYLSAVTEPATSRN